MNLKVKINVNIVLKLKISKKINLQICKSNLQILASDSQFRLIFEKFVPEPLYSTLLQVDMTSVFKKEDVFLLKNYRPVSVLHVVSKIYERVIQKQILEYVDRHLSPHICG